MFPALLGTRSREPQNNYRPGARFLLTCAALSDRLTNRRVWRVESDRRSPMITTTFNQTVVAARLADISAGFLGVIASTWRSTT